MMCGGFFFASNKSKLDTEENRPMAEERMMMNVSVRIFLELGTKYQRSPQKVVCLLSLDEAYKGSLARDYQLPVFQRSVSPPPRP